MSPPEPFRVIRSRPSRAASPQDEALDHDSGASRRQFASAHPILLCGQSLVDNGSLLEKLRAHGYRIIRHRSLRDAPSVLEHDPAVIALIEASSPRQAEAVEMIRRLDPRYRRRVIGIVWRPARAMVRQFIEAGAGDFLTLPAPPSELLLRIELRAREARASLFAERYELRAGLPELNHLDGSLGPESGNVRLSDREFLLYDILSQRFGTVVSRSDILARIWGRDPANEPASNIVDVYVRYLRVKLAKVAPTLVITTVRHVGYVLERREE